MKNPLEPDCAALDQRDRERFAPLQELFAPGARGIIYFDAGSIGPMPADAPRRVQETLQSQWRIGRRRSWNDTDWLEQPRRLGARLAPVIGASADDVVVGDSTSVNLYKLIRNALSIAAPRRVIVAERDAFPTDLYVVEGIAEAGLAELRVIANAGELNQALAPGDVAVVALSHVDYRSSERHDMRAVCALARTHGALTVWDLSHSAGAVRIELRECGADFAVSCGYKYLCGGPGAPSLFYVHPKWHDAAWPAICGWMGHADTFAFRRQFTPATGPARHLVGSPPVVANVVFGAAAEIWSRVDIEAIDARHRSLSDTLIALLERRCHGFGIELQGPREHERRGGHVAIRFERASALVQALCDRGVVASSREPDTVRFSLHPITTRHVELEDAVERLRDLLDKAAWRDARYQHHVV